MSVPERIKPFHPAQRVLKEVGVAAHGARSSLQPCARRLRTNHGDRPPRVSIQGVMV